MRSSAGYLVFLYLLLPDGRQLGKTSGSIGAAFPHAGHLFAILNHEVTSD